MKHPDLCKECGGRCCTSPLVSNREIRDMMAKLGAAEVLAVGPIHEGNGWHRLPVCPALTPTGCALTWRRPIVCRLYPFQFIAMPSGGYRIMLDVDMCPSWMAFGEEYKEAMMEFTEFLAREAGYADTTQS
jgi:Fe-S-cluster containining protein